MTALQWIWTVWVGLGWVYGLAMAASSWRARRAMVRLAHEAAPEPAQWPQLSVIIPACNEASTLEAAMSTKLEQDYSPVEFILVDDRSTDDTGAIVDRIGARDERVKPVHVTELPDGWLGKVHALHEGTKVARGQWLLFTDADVHFERGALRHAIAYCEAHRLDHLALLPSMTGAGLLADSAVAVFVRLVLILGRPWAVPSDDPKTGVGVGAFNLVRRRAFDATGGFEDLKLEVSDDLALGRMLKASGAKPALASGRGIISVQLYSSVRELAVASERAAIVLNFSLVRSIVAFMVWLGLEFAPFAGLFPLAGGPLAILSACVVGIILGAAVVAGKEHGVSVLASLLLPLGSALLAVVTLRAGVVGWARGGLRWRGTHYDAAELLAGRNWGKM